ncbi:MAG: ATP-binding protein, partial [Sphaerochaetaceae bacterium]
SDEQFNSAIPSSIRKEFMIIDFPLPDKKEVREILDNIIEAVKASPKFKMPKKDMMDDLVESALGLTKRGCQNAYSYSIIEGAGVLDPKIVSAIRSAEINETAGLSVGQYDVGDILGYENAKDYIRKAINNPDSRGVLLLGPPGVGKTHLAKWTSTISSKILIEFELAGVQGEGLYGQAENAMAEALRVVKSIGNCVLFLDEIEKAIPSKAATNDTTGTRSFSQLLKFLSDSRPEGCFVIATCNDISKLPPEWVRSERFDVIFFADLPTEPEKQAIYDHYLEHYKVEAGNLDISCMEQWTGAEIKTACRLAKVMGTPCDQSAEFVVPIAKTMKDDIIGLRRWSEGRSIPASKSNKTPKHPAGKTPKRVRRSVDV